MAKMIDGVHRHLAAWRRHAALTQEQVANILEISGNSLSEKERGVRNIKPRELAKLGELYKCEPWMLLAFDPSDPRLDALRIAVGLIDKMTPRQAAAWAEMGASLVDPTK